MTKKKAQVAVVDQDMTLIEYKTVKEDIADCEIVTEEDGTVIVGVPDNCDLEPGKYWFDEKQVAWIPIRKPASDPLGITIQALSDGLLAVRDQLDVQFPSNTIAFLDIWEKSGKAELRRSPTVEDGMKRS